MVLKILSIASRMHYNYPKLLLKKQNPSLCCRYMNNVSDNKMNGKVNERRKIGFYFLYKYVEYIKNYNSVLEKRFPKAMTVYKVFMVGIKEFYTDVIEFMKIFKLTQKNGFKVLTRRELEVYDRVPSDMLKISPVLLISALPFANYVVFPLAYMYPRLLLTSHFWNKEQKNEFKIIKLKSRLQNNKPIFESLKNNLKCTKTSAVHEKWEHILGCLGSGVHPHTSQILECKELFTKMPYHLLYLHRNHVKHLIKLHDLHIGIFRKGRLADRANILQHMDMAIMMEGGAHNLSQNAIIHACYLRGLNTDNMAFEEMVKWLNQWILISKAVDKTCWSLLLHLPILLGYNQPSNWQLIYTKKL